MSGAMPTAVTGPLVTRISDTTCSWAMVAKDGRLYPHAIAARRRVRQAGEFLDGDYCLRHARMAVEWSIAGIEPAI